MKSRLLLVLLSFALLAGCGGGKSSTTTTTNSPLVTLTPASASVPINTTQQFTATVSNSSSGVYWSVNDTLNGNLTIGTISASGLYTAPAVIPNPATVTIKATSVADTTQVSTATVTITSGTALSLTVSPSTASVYTGRSQQFTANFNSSSNTGVTWQVNTVTGGDTTHGTITAAGLYTAPATVPSPATVTITAISQADTTKTATATVTVVLGTTIAISPSFATVPAGGTQTFTATANSQPIAVTWSLNCNAPQPSGCGSISSAGVYTAPPFPPPGGGAVAITATANDNSALPASSNVVIQISNGSLSGKYAFSFAGKNGSTSYVSAGSVTLDGSGNITGGLEDVNNGASSSVTISGGTYHIGTDGRGNATVQTSSGTETWQFVLKDNTKAFLMRGDTNVTGTGTLYLQDSTQFAGSAITGNYTMQLSGPAAGQGGSAAYAGAFTANGAGTISSGKLDISSGTTATTALGVTGGYSTPDAGNGRGTLTLVTTSGTQNFAYYIVSGARAVLVETDAARLVRGEMVQQTAGPFALASFNGTFVMLVSGANAQGPVAMGSIFILNGGNVSSGVADINSNGNVQTQVAVTGSYAVTDAATGRTEATLTVGGQARKFVLYPEAANTAVALEIDGVQTTVGRAYVQSANAATASVFQGAYSASLTGTDFINSPGEEDVVGLLVPNGGSAISGTVDINDNGALAHSVPVSATYLASTVGGRNSGTLTTTSNTLASGQFIYYVIDSTHTALLESDSSRVLVGVMEKP